MQLQIKSDFLTNSPEHLLNYRRRKMWKLFSRHLSTIITQPCFAKAKVVTFSPPADN